MARVSAVSSYEIAVRDLAQSKKFYTDVWGLSVVHEDAQSCYLRTTGPAHHAIALHQRSELGLIRINFEAPDRAAVAAILDQVKAAGGTVQGNPAPFGGPGGGYGFTCCDKEGRELRVLSDMAHHKDTKDVADRPRKLSHVVLNSVDVDAARTFFCEALGFRLSDQTQIMDFIRCNTDHHSIAFARDSATSFNHSAWEMPTWDGLMYGAGRLKESGYNVEWGLGRHGPGANIYTYFVEPSGYAIEYTTEVQQIDEATHKVGTPKDWQRGPNRMDRWGFSPPPSERMRAAMHGAGQAHA
jgi:catechol 2,3-dioxygenase-like lactoylglutathione lyase family enzyme